jgi:hypothetical protein
MKLKFTRSNSLRLIILPIKKEKNLDPEKKMNKKEERASK